MAKCNLEIVSFSARCLCSERKRKKGFQYLEKTDVSKHGHIFAGDSRHKRSRKAMGISMEA